ncbi:hypothetical protein F2Q68_00038298 [Brassica cretica]|uniref:S-protein homolog n=2 Tax=Brassica cretica TaxID=69181 RepID=A0ABQ7AMV3_BRACR|nr:hypothetical protein F2Q68_00038298 [Brassica cretica]KAF3498880.1 hypothetical protein DY000_02051891 [Brassica cretica]
MRNSPKLYVAFLIMVLLFGPSHELPPFWLETTVTMTNNLGGPLLTVHCKSKDNDLGVHMVAANTDYHFTFQSNLWKSTLFFCSFQWNNQAAYSCIGGATGISGFHGIGGIGKYGGIGGAVGIGGFHGLLG